jgi:hypothetical protein
MTENATAGQVFVDANVTVFVDEGPGNGVHVIESAL